jgi:hypothetical protein
LLERVERAGKKFGYMLAVDGRWGRIRSKGGDLLLHTALNVLLQMTGSLVMKWGECFAEDEAVSNGVIDSIDDFPIIAHVHDEAQMEIPKADVEEMEYVISGGKEGWKREEKRTYIDTKGRMWSAPVCLSDLSEDCLTIRRRYHPLGEIYCKSITKAGEFLKLRCPTAGEYMLGDSWEETH